MSAAVLKYAARATDSCRAMPNTSIGNSNGTFDISPGNDGTVAVGNDNDTVTALANSTMVAGARSMTCCNKWEETCHDDNRN